MPDKVDKYVCLENSCIGQHAMRWTHFLKHQRVSHNRQWTLHIKCFYSYVEFQVWCRFVQEGFMRLPVVKQIDGILHATCDVASSTTCPARIFARRVITGVDQVGILVVYMGEHYGHAHLPDREERLFLLDYFPLMSTPMDKWLIHFRHAGVFLMTHTNTMLRKKARNLQFRTEPLIVVGFMNEQQLRILKKFQSTICLENHGNWIVMYSLALRADDHSMTPLSFPVAYCFSSFMDETIIAEFFYQIKKRIGVLDCVLVVSNNEIFAGAWAKVFSESQSIFMQSWQDLVDKIIFSRNQLDYDEAIEIEEILRIAICGNFPNITNITKEFTSAAIHSKKLNVDTILSLSNRERQECLFELIDEWVGELIAVGLTKSFRDKMFSSENYYISRAIMSAGHVPKVMMDLTLHFRHVLNNSPQLADLENFVCSIEYTE